MVHIHNVILLSYKKKNTFESVLMRWMKLEPIIQNEVSQKEKLQYSVLTHIYGIYKDGNDNPVSVQFSSVTQSCPTLCDPMNCSMPGLPVHHQLPEFTQTHVHRLGDAIQPDISSSVIPFSSCPQSLPASESFPMCQLFT